MSNNTKFDIQNTKYKLTLGWLYPELMSTYGDRGNILVLQKIAEDNGINVDVVRINQTHDASLITKCDLLFMGGAQDLQQEIVNRDLMGEKGNILKKLIEKGIPGLYICGAYQFLGNYYKDAYGTTIPGLEIFDMYTESYKSKPRLIGNIVIDAFSNLDLEHGKENSTKNQTPKAKSYLVGFENHGGRTFLKDKKLAFAKVIKGYGNNGEDKTEGILFKNSIGTYLHGPILPSNPELAVWLLNKAYEIRYGTEGEVTFEAELSEKARSIMLRKLHVKY